MEDTLRFLNLDEHPREGPLFIPVYQEAILLGISMYLPHNAVLHEDVRLD